MIRVATMADIARLMQCAKKSNERLRSQTQKQGYRILLDLVSRLPHPRAYLLEPSHRPDREREMQTWQFGMDLLSVHLEERNISVIDPDSLRFLLVHCPALHYHLDHPDPLWRPLVAAGVIDQVYIPEDGANNKRHEQARKHAESHSIEVHAWHLAWGP